MVRWCCCFIGLLAGTIVLIDGENIRKGSDGGPIAGARASVDLSGDIVASGRSRVPRCSRKVSTPVGPSGVA